MKIRPHITLLFLLSVYTVLLLISFLFDIFLPEDKDEFSVLGISLAFPKPENIFSTPEKYADISSILAENKSLSADSLSIDTIALAEEIPVFDTIRADENKLRKVLRAIEYPDGKRDMLFSVFKAMDSAKSKGKVVRIMHYGDSQIEGDRMTSFYRNKLQNQFGGKGVGLIPARQLYDFRYSLFQDASSNWNRYTLYGNRDTLIQHNRYGILASFCSFTPQPLTDTDNSSDKTAWIDIKPSPYSYQNTKYFDQCRVFYSNNSADFEASLYVNDTIVDSGIYAKSKGLKQIKWTFSQPVGNIKLEFEAPVSPEIYGIALDGNSGVAVDNIAMRGCAGLVFTKMDSVLFRQLINDLDVKLMILQFGGNIVPNIRKNYGFYERWFFSQLNYIKTNAPEVEIIVIGVADMSMKKNDRYVSYPNIELVRNAMKKASFRAGAAYWDMFEAMGGRNSMPSWVFAQPSLAGKDFVHFNPRGAKIVANMFYNAFMSEYDRYKRLSK
ncbi:MAG: hypothetical protein JXA77_03350 [Bacteroidales bacterium]|nr:hypothetical protein [Bacteroidales bacterium]MBN2818406.1 hypothetical protein [Bacteroidales bacterium]